MSLIDQEFMRQVYHEKQGCLPQSFGILTGSFDQSFLKKLKVSPRPLAKKVQTALQLIFPDFPALEIRGAALERWKSSLKEPWVGEAYQELRKSIVEKLGDIRALTQGPTSFSLKRKFKGLYHTFVPFAFWNFLRLPKENIKEGTLRFFYPSGFHQLKPL